MHPAALDEVKKELGVWEQDCEAIESPPSLIDQDVGTSPRRCGSLMSGSVHDSVEERHSGGRSHSRDIVPARSCG